MLKVLLKHKHDRQHLCGLYTSCESGSHASGSQNAASLVLVQKSPTGSMCSYVGARYEIVRRLDFEQALTSTKTLLRKTTRDRPGFA